ncbi:LPXTG cell wall anchor domain-containing protein, partial [Leucobacter sp. 1207-22]|uniref:LPXTG cell wall anchor domain-containing protein n=1 Tax=Leucobacter sp. 1207-22 TaxID=2604456 RepID=UPI0040632668
SKASASTNASGSASGNVGAKPGGLATTGDNLHWPVLAGIALLLVAGTGLVIAARVKRQAETPSV